MPPSLPTPSLPIPSLRSRPMPLLPLLCLLCLLPLSSPAPTPLPAIQSYPTSMQIRMVTVLAQGSTYIIGTTYTITFSAFALNIASCFSTITLSGISFTSALGTNIGVQCQQTGLTSTTMDVQCRRSTGYAVTMITLSYFVGNSASYTLTDGTWAINARNQYITTAINAGVTRRTIPRIGQLYNTMHRHRCFVFIQGFYYTRSVSPSTFKQQCQTIGANHQLQFTLTNLQLDYLALAIVSIDVTQLTLNRRITVDYDTHVFPDTDYNVGVSIKHLHNTATNAYLMGLKDFTLGAGSNTYSFMATQMNTTMLLSHDSSAHNQIMYLWIRKLTCSTPTDILSVLDKTCTPLRTCSAGPQFQILPTVSAPLSATIHPSHRIAAYNMDTNIQIIRYNGSHFVPYAQIYDPQSPASTIIKYLTNQDYSRIAFITTGNKFYIYAWNGSAYEQQYLYALAGTGQVYRLYQMGSSEGFKVVVLVYERAVAAQSYSRNQMKILTYNETVNTYTVSDHHPMPSKVIKLVLENNWLVIRAVVVTARHIHHLIYNKQINKFITIAEPVLHSQTAQVTAPYGIDYVAISPTRNTIAIGYTRQSVNTNYLLYGIKILGYNFTQKKYSVFQRIAPAVYDNLSPVGGYVMQFDPRQVMLILKPKTTQYGHRIVYKRTNVHPQYPFVLDEIIGRQQSLGIVMTSNSALAASTDMQMLISGDIGNNLLLYYCRSLFNQFYYSPYAIPIARSMSTPVPTTPNTTNNTNATLTPAEQKLQQQSKNKQSQYNQQQIIQIVMIVMVALMAVLTVGLAVYLGYRAWQGRVQKGGEGQAGSENQGVNLVTEESYVKEGGLAAGDSLGAVDFHQ